MLKINSFDFSPWVYIFYLIFDILEEQSAAGWTTSNGTGKRSVSWCCYDLGNNSHKTKAKDDCTFTNI